MTGPNQSLGMRFREALSQEKPLQMVGTINAMTAMLAKKAGFKAIYLSGAGVANASFGLPDLGMTNLSDVAEEVRKITGAVDLPLLVDMDTGWGNEFNIARAVRELTKAGAAGAHIEDQVHTKRCGHRPNLVLVNTQEMVNRLKAALDAKTDPHFVIMARTDALRTEGLDAALDRVKHYVEAGAEMIFFEGVRELSEYEALAKVCKVPILANITEFGLTPLFTKEELKKAGCSIILYPLSAFRAMNAAAEAVFNAIRKDGTQQSQIDNMQTRQALYEVLNYMSYEKKSDELFAEGAKHE